MQELFRDIREIKARGFEQIKTEIKAILSDSCGEIFVPRLKKKINALNNNKLIWILSGQLYNSPRSSFINFYADYKLNILIDKFTEEASKATFLAS